MRRQRHFQEQRFAQQFKDAGRLDDVDPTVARLIVQSGHADGDKSDDKIKIKKSSWPAARLKPSQTSMVLGKALSMAIGMLDSGKVGGDLGALVSSDGHILDGHHRWAATILASGKKGKVGGYAANIPGKNLLRVLNILSKGSFEVRGGKPGKGALSAFTEKNVRDMITEFAMDGIPGKWGRPAEEVQSILAANFGSVEDGIDAISTHARYITKVVPPWAPDRKQMPVVDPENVPDAVKSLSLGKVDWTAPYAESLEESLDALINYGR